MSRVEIEPTVQSGTFPVTGAQVYVYTRGTTDEVTVFATETAPEVLTQPLTSLNGNIEGWVTHGQSLDLVITYGDVSRTLHWEAFRADAIIAGIGHVVQDETTSVTQRSNLSFQGTAVSVTDDEADDRTVVTITAGGSKHLVKDEGSSVADRGSLNFVGDGVTVTDDSGNDATVVTIPGADGPHVVQDETSDMTQRSKLAFVGSNVAVTDDAASDRTVVTVADDPVAPMSVVFSQETAATGPSHKVFLPRALTLDTLRLSCVTAPGGSALTVTVSKNGTTIDTLSIADGATTTDTSSPATAFAEGDTLSVNATSVGSTSAAEGVAVQADFSE